MLSPEPVREVGIVGCYHPVFQVRELEAGVSGHTVRSRACPETTSLHSDTMLGASQRGRHSPCEGSEDVAVSTALVPQTLRKKHLH